MIAASPVDPQAVGWRHIGDRGYDAQGVLATAPTYGPLVEVPFHTISNTSIWSTYGAGFWEVQAGGSPTVTNYQRPIGNTDGSSSSVVIAMPAFSASYVRFRSRVWGRRFGVRWEWSSSRATAPFHVIIDGVPYTVSPLNQDRDFISGVARTSRLPLTRWICPDILPDICHDVEILFDADVTGGAARTYVLHGVLLDSNYGYRRPDPMMGVYGPYPVTNAWTVFNPNTGLLSWDIINCRFSKLIAYNSSGGDATINYGLGLSDGLTFYRKTLATLTQDVFDLGPTHLFLPILGIKASVGPAIEVWAFAGAA